MVCEKELVLGLIPQLNFKERSQYHGDLLAGRGQVDSQAPPWTPPGYS